MATTEKYGLFVGEANDPFSPLIQFNENMRSIDSRMWENNQRGVRVVSEIKTGRVHELTTVNGAGNMMRFVATANWESGDSCTVDGTAVTTLLPSGQPLPNGAWVINSNVLCCLVGTVLTVFTYYIGEYAPAGYGLGEEETPLIASDEQLDSTVVSGFYRVFISGKNWGGVTSNGGSMIVSSALTSRLTQVVFLQGANTIVFRYMWNNNWSEWMILNPPMMVGVEYRTAENYENKSVFAKKIDFGSLPNSSEKSVESGIENLENLVRFNANLGANGSNALNFPNVTVNVQSGTIHAVTTDDRSGFPMFVTLYYTKTTN